MRKLLLILFLFGTAYGQTPQSFLIAKKASSGGFTPPSGCKLWVKADQIGGLSDGDPVSTWSDQSGNGNDLTGSGGVRPTYQTSEINSLPVIRFDGSDDYLGATVSGVMGNAGMTVIVVLKTPSAADKTVMSMSDYNTADSWIWQSANANNWRTFIFDHCTTDAGSNHEDNDGSEYLSSVYHVFSLSYDGGQSNTDRVKYYMDGTVMSSTTTGTIATSLVSCSVSLKVGRIGGGIIPRYFDSDIAEIFIFDSALGTTDRQSVENYLKTKYGL